MTATIVTSPAPRTERRTLRLGVALVLLCAIAVGGAVFLATIGIDALEGKNEFQFFADSGTYHAVARGDVVGIEELNELIGIVGNFLGPLMIVKLAGGNYYAILVINCVLFFWSLVLITRALRIDAPRLMLFLFLNPMTVSSLLSVNKEILSIVFVALLVSALARRSLVALALAAALSVLVRWQLTLFIVGLLATISPLNPLRARRGWTIIAILVTLSALYAATLDVIEPVRMTFESSAEEYEGSGFYAALVGYQDRGLYWLIFPAKAASLLFALGLRIDRLVAPDNIYNDVWQLLHSTTMLVTFVLVWRRRRLTLANDLVFVSAVYIALFTLSPIYTPRYFYAAFVLWAIALAADSDRPPLFAPRASRAATRVSVSTTPEAPAHA